MKAMRETGNFYAPAKRLPTASAMPGTTLGIIPLKAFEGKGTLYDTPGVFLHHRLNSLLGPEELTSLRLGNSLRRYAPKPTIDEKEFGSFEGMTLIYGDYVRVDVLRATPSVSFTFFGPKSMKVELIETSRMAAIIERTQTTEEKDAGMEGGLRVLDTPELSSLQGEMGSIADLSVSGMGGWIAVNKDYRKDDAVVELRLWGPPGLEFFVRKPMPVGP